MENEDGAWVWLEYIQETTGEHWSLEYFRRTARQLGRFQGAYLNGVPLVDQSWLFHFFTSIWGKDDFWLKFMDPTAENNVWQSPVTKRGWDDR